MFADYFKKKGVVHQVTCRYTPQQNGVVERMNRTILDKIRCMLINSNSDPRLWGEAFHAAIYLINRIEPASETKTPVKVWTGKTPSGKFLKRFGCIAYVHIPKELQSKLEARANKRIFVGYADSQKGNRLYDPETKCNIE